ncbi:MAG: L-2-amino-thiazoline-4-carboxylic acid hydrolase [Anaerolineaceae bacterium]
MNIYSEYYQKKAAQLLREFDRSAKKLSPVLAKFFPHKNIHELIEKTRHQYEILIPQMPYVGGKEPFTRFVIYSGMLLAVYRIARAEGMAVEDIGIMAYEIGKSYLKAYPAFLRRFMAQVNFKPSYLKRLKERAEESHLRLYPDDFVFDFIEGDRINFDYGVDYHECAICKFFIQQNASEFTPYLCPMDILYSQSLEWGLVRTTTLAEGADRCDFRFKKGGQTRVNVPAALKKVIADPL